VDGPEAEAGAGFLAELHAALEQPAVAKILDHLRIPSTPPPVAPPRLPALQTDLLK
jgi:hypothetical protein